MTFWLMVPMTLSACQTTGLVFGGSEKALSSPQLIAALNGGLVGQVSALELTNTDQRLALASEYRALEYAAPGELVTWQSSAVALAGQVTASQPYRVGSQNCRQYSHRIFSTQVTASGSAPAAAHGTACRNIDGSWNLLGRS
ncbi:MAG: hypothetical protein AAFR71_05400 [Pseudomonadota bacterium]